MSSTSSMGYVSGAVVLGFVGNVASWRRLDNVPTDHTRVALCISQVATTDDGAHTPAQSVTLYGREALSALRGAIDEALKEGVADERQG